MKSTSIISMREVQFSLKKRLEIPFIPPLQTEAERKSHSVSFHIRAKNFG